MPGARHIRDSYGGDIEGKGEDEGEMTAVLLHIHSVGEGMKVIFCMSHISYSHSYYLHPERLSVDVEAAITQVLSICVHFAIFL